MKRFPLADRAFLRPKSPDATIYKFYGDTNRRELNLLKSRTSCPKKPISTAANYKKYKILPN